MTTAAIFINGKFAAQPLTGVQRVGHELTIALDVLLSKCAARYDWQLLCPSQAPDLELRAIAQRRWPARAWPLHLWEQTLLPWRASGGLLVNLAGTGPWIAPPQVVLHHDAAVFDHPEAYTSAFVHWYGQLFARQARTAQRSLVVSAFSRERLAQSLRIPAANWQVMPLGADHLLRVAAGSGVLARLGVQPGGYLLAVASANPSKNLAALLAAHAGLPAPRPPLVLVGGANDRVFAPGGHGGDQPGLLRTGRLDDAALRALYEGALALVFPSLYEGCGLPPLEAMSLGCPVLASRCAALPETCGDAALYADAPDAAGLRAALLRLLTEPALRERLRAAGLAHSRQRTWARAAAQLRAVIEEVQAPV